MIFESNTISLAKVTDGQDGVGQYVHIMYSDIENPQSPGDISTVPLDYMGVCITESPIAPTDPSQYTWSKIRGEDGRPGATGRPGQPGQDGATYYIHIKWSNDGGQTFAEGTGAWLGVYTDTSPDPIEIPMLYQWTRVAGTDGTVISLSNESHTVPTDPNGLAGNYVGAETKVTILEGKSDTTSLWNISYIESKGVTGSFLNNVYTLTEILEDTGYVDFTATKTGYSTLTKRFQIARTKSGESAKVYKLLCDTTILHKDTSGNLSSDEIILTAKSYTDASIDSYLGRFKVTIDGTVVYESAKDESATVVKIPNTSVSIVAELYSPIGDLLDSQSVAVVTDGQQGSNGKTYSLNIKGNTTNFIYDYTGSNPMPQNIQPFSAELYENGTLITEGVEYSWGSKSVNSVLSGISTGPTFVPVLSPNYNPETQYENAVVLIAKYEEQVLYAAQPIIIQQSAAPGESTITAVLSNDSHIIPISPDNPTGDYTGASTTVSVYEGTKDVSIAWSVAAQESEGITGNLVGKTYTVTGMTVDSGYVDLICSRTGYPSMTKRFQLSRVESGLPGEAATTYWIICSPNVVHKLPDGKLSPEKITIVGKSQTGSQEIASYGCRYKILVNDSVVYTSVTDEVTLEYSVPLDAKTLSIEMYESGDTAVLLDQQTVQVLTDGSPGKGVVSVDVLYYKSSSALSLSDGEWTTENPGWEEGKYIWSKTVVTYTDDTVEETIPVCITGSAGETGTGVESIIEEYYKSTSAVVLQDGIWTPDYPGWESDKFIWTRSTIKYTDGEVKVTDPICVSGSKGVDGTPGYTVYLTNQYETFLCNSSNEIVKDTPVSTKAMVYRGSEELECTIGEIAEIPGMTTMVTGNMITFTAIKGSDLADQGSVEIPVIADEKNFTVSFSWSKIVDASGDLEEIRSSITEVKNITDNLNERIELSVTKTEFNDTNAAINKQFSALNISLEGISSEVSSMKTDFGDQIIANSTKIDQTAEKLSLIATGDGESGITITPGFIELISTDIIGLAAEEFKIDALTTFMNSATTGDKTVINGGAIDTVSLTAKIIEAQILKSKNYVEGEDPNSSFALEGTYYDLETGALNSKNFAITDDGNVFVRGTIYATDGTFSGTVEGSTIKGSTIIGGDITGVTISGQSSITCGDKFKVTADGKLTASDAEITGKITATSGSFTGTITGSAINGGSITGALITAENAHLTNATISGRIDAMEGTIGGFTISNDSLYSGSDYLGGSGVYVSPNGISCNDTFVVDSNGFMSAITGTIAGFTFTNTQNDLEHAYANTLYRIVHGNDGYDYQAGIKAASPTNGETEAAFYIRKKRSTESSWANSTLPFYVRNNGFVYANEITIGNYLYMDGYVYTNDNFDYKSTRVPVLQSGINEVFVGYLKNDTGYYAAFGDSNGEFRLGYSTSTKKFTPFAISYDSANRVFDMGPTSTDIEVDLGTYWSFRTLNIKKISFEDGTVMTTAKGGSGGTTNYNNLINKPIINGTTLDGGSSSANDDIRTKTPKYIDIKLNGKTQGAGQWKGGYDLDINVTASSIGAAPSSHSHGLGDINWTNGRGKVVDYRGFGHIHTVLINDNSSNQHDRAIAISGMGSNAALIPYTVSGFTSPNDYDLSQGATMDLGTSSSNWRTLYVDSIVLNGTKRNTWPSGGSTYSAGTGITISGSTISVNTSTIATKSYVTSSISNISASSIGAAPSSHSHRPGDISWNTPSQSETNGHKHQGLRNANGYGVDMGNNTVFLGRFNNSNSEDISLGSSACWFKELYANTVHYTTLKKGSDIRLKNSVMLLQKSIEESYMNFNAISYKYNDDLSSKTHYGFVAQNIIESISNNGLSINNSSLVSVDENGMYSLAYDEFIPLNTYMTQKAHHRIDSLEQENQKLRNDILILQGELALLKEEINNVKN